MSACKAYIKCIQSRTPLIGTILDGCLFELSEILIKMGKKIGYFKIFIALFLGNSVWTLIFTLYGETINL